MVVHLALSVSSLGMHVYDFIERRLRWMEFGHVNLYLTVCSAEYYILNVLNWLSWVENSRAFETKDQYDNERAVTSQVSQIYNTY